MKRAERKVHGVVWPVQGVAMAVVIAVALAGRSRLVPRVETLPGVKAELKVDVVELRR